MSDKVSLPDLDKLHAEATPGPWKRLAGSSWCIIKDVAVANDGDVIADCEPEFEDGWDMGTIGAQQREWSANADLIVALHNTWPTISARLKELEFEKREALQMYHAARADHGSEALENAVKRLSERNKLLTETLRGILQDKRARLETANSITRSKSAHCETGTLDESREREELLSEIAWLESVLGGNP